MRVTYINVIYDNLKYREVILSTYRAIDLMSTVLANGFQSQVETYQNLKIVLDTALLNTQHYKVKGSNSENGVVPSATLQSSSY